MYQICAVRVINFTMQPSSPTESHEVTSRSWSLVACGSQRASIFSFGVGHVPLFQPLFQVVGCCCCLGVCAAAQVRHLWAMPCVVG
jgi:hypothetical protein